MPLVFSPHSKCSTELLNEYTSIRLPRPGHQRRKLQLGTEKRADLITRNMWSANTIWKRRRVQQRLVRRHWIVLRQLDPTTKLVLHRVKLAVTVDKQFDQVRPSTTSPVVRGVHEDNARAFCEMANCRRTVIFGAGNFWLALGSTLPTKLVHTVSTRRSKYLEEPVCTLLRYLVRNFVIGSVARFYSQKDVSELAMLEDGRRFAWCEDICNSGLPKLLEDRGIIGGGGCAAPGGGYDVWVWTSAVSATLV
jgi:hypothetical protein